MVGGLVHYFVWALANNSLFFSFFLSLFGSLAYHSKDFMFPYSTSRPRRNAYYC